MGVILEEAERRVRREDGWMDGRAGWMAEGYLLGGCKRRS
jgi:hypothetical protein